MLFFAATLATATANGARFMQNYIEGMPPVVRESDLWPWNWLIQNPGMCWAGFAYSLTLLGILLVHEFGHYTACVVHRIRATLPWVLPAPTLSGTFGAVIRIRTRIPDRDALLDVGLYGPLAGYLASMLAVAVGLVLSAPRPDGAPDALVRFGGDPLTIQFLHRILAHWDPSVPSFSQASPHPVLVAGWIGLFITALNLIPGGQLDGGHILYALSPRMHTFCTRLLPWVLFVAGAFYWVGWILWGLFLLIPALRHPRVPQDTHLSRGRAYLGLLGIAIFALTFTPAPFTGNSLLDLLNIDPLHWIR